MWRVRWWVAAWLAWGAPAHAASQLVLTSDRPVIIVVNAKPHSMTGSPDEKIVVKFENGEEGHQNVRVRNLLGVQQWAGKVEVPRGHRITGWWNGKTFDMYKDEALPSARLAESRDRQAGQRTTDAAERARLYRMRSGGGFPDPPIPEEDSHPLDDPYADAVREAGTSSAVPPDEAGDPVAIEDEAPAPLPAAGGTGTLRLVHRTTSWANAYVDGELVEFRGDSAQELPLSTGPHDVVFRDFRDKEEWSRGTVYVYPDFVVELQFGQHAAPRAINRAEAFQPN